jgi:hypothetical protein
MWFAVKGGLVVTEVITYKIERVQRKFAALCSSRFFVGVCCNNFEIILAGLNLSTLYSSRPHLDVLFLINVFKRKITSSSIFNSVSVRIPTRIIRDDSAFMVNRNFKFIPSPRYISASNAIFKDIDIFNKDYTSLTDIL